MTDHLISARQAAKIAKRHHKTIMRYVTRDHARLQAGEPTVFFHVVEFVNKRWYVRQTDAENMTPTPHSGAAAHGNRNRSIAAQQRKAEQALQKLAELEAML